MNQEMPIKNIYQRLHSVMESVKYVQKEDKKVNGQYRFVSHDSVAAIIRPELVKNGILLITSIKSHIQQGNCTEVDLELTFCNIDHPEDKIIINAFGYGIDNQDKGPGKAISYGVKYALLKMFCLETGDDPEQDNIEYKNKIVIQEKNTSAENLSVFSQPLVAQKLMAQKIIKEDQDSYDLLINAIMIQIENINNANDANEFKNLMQNTKHINDSRKIAWEKLKNRTTELKLIYKDGKYI